MDRARGTACERRVEAVFRCDRENPSRAHGSGTEEIRERPRCLGDTGEKSENRETEGREEAAEPRGARRPQGERWRSLQRQGRAAYPVWNPWHALVSGRSELHAAKGRLLPASI